MYIIALRNFIFKLLKHNYFQTKHTVFLPVSFISKNFTVTISKHCEVHQNLPLAKTYIYTPYLVVYVI